MGRIFNIQHFCVDDGPGIRTTLFLKGCPLKCKWCHNPESQNGNNELMFREEKCIMCGNCIPACPNGVHSISEGKHLLDRSRCINCGACAKQCYFGALEMTGRECTVDEVVKELLADKVFYKHSGGGITVSGGEPLFQAKFTLEILKRCKEEGLHTCIETCGFGKREDLLEMSGFTDLFLYDYKLTDNEKHKEMTGVTNDLILDNLDALCKRGADIIIRCPMIPGVNLEEEHFDGIVSLSKKYPQIREIHLEGYHPLGISKANALGKTGYYDNSDFMDKKELEKIKEYISERISIPVKTV